MQLVYTTENRLQYVAIEPSRRFKLTMYGLYEEDEVFPFRARTTRVAPVVLVLEGFKLGGRIIRKSDMKILQKRDSGGSEN
jgi:hypothetical protein